MKVRSAIASALLTIAILVPRGAHAAGAFPFDGIPGLAPEQHLEMVVLIEDLREIKGAWEASQKQLDTTAMGKAFLSHEHQKALLGFDLQGELAHLIAIVAPNDGAVPAVLVAVSDPEGYRVQGAIKVQPGAIERLLAAKDGLHATGTPSAFALVAGEHTLPAKMDGAWLRFGATDADLALTGTPPLTALPPTFAKWAADSHIVIAALGGGKFSEGVASLLESNPIGAQLARSVKAFGFTLRYDDDRSQILRMVLDADGIRDFAPMLARPQSQTSLAGQWDAQALRAFQMALPPTLMPTLAMIAQSQLGETPDPNVASLIDSLADFNGTLSAATFGAPADWSIALDFRDEAAAKTLVGRVHKLIDVTFQKYGVEPGLVTLANKGETPVLTVRPDVALPAITITTVGNKVHVTRQANRIARALEGKGNKLIDGPLTPAVHEVLNRNAFVTGYAVSGTDGSIFELMYWPAKIAEIGIRHFKDMLPVPADGATAFASPMSAMSASRLPLTFAVAAYGFASIYDYALSLDVDDSAVVFQFASSQL